MTLEDSGKHVGLEEHLQRWVGLEGAEKNEGVNFKQRKMMDTGRGRNRWLLSQNSQERLEEPVKDKSSFQIQAGLYPEGGTVSWGVGSAKCPQKTDGTNSQDADLIQ